MIRYAQREHQGGLTACFQRRFIGRKSQWWLSHARASRLEECFTSTKVSPEDFEDAHGTTDAAEDDCSFVERLGHRGDAVGAELKRLRWILSEKQQFLSTKLPWSFCPATYEPTAWLPIKGSSSVIVGPLIALARRAVNLRRPSPAGDDHKSLVEQPADAWARRMLRMRELHRLNYYGTLELIPKRTIQHSAYIILWNALVALQHSCTILVYYVARAVSRRGASTHSLPISLIVALGQGLWDAAQFLALGLVVSPIIHIPSGLINSCWGFTSFFRGNLFFDANSGRYFYCDLRHYTEAQMISLLEELKTIKVIGTTEFHRKRMEPDGKFKEQIKHIGFRIRKSHQARLRGKHGIKEDDDDLKQDPYEVLRVKRSSTTSQIKQQYKKLAKVFHPDAVQAQNGGNLSKQQKEDAQQKFESLSEAYQILSNPERKRAFDQGGRQGLKLSETKLGHFASASAGEMVQSVFGGRTFKETLLGELYKSHWDLRFQHQVAVSMHGLECMQSIRVILLALKLRDIVDVHALDNRPTVSPLKASNFGEVPSKPQRASQSTKVDPLLASASKVRGDDAKGTPDAPSPESPLCDQNKFSLDFKKRCDAFAKSLQGACFGPALLDDIGQSYAISARRFLGVDPFYGPKLLAYRNLTRGFGSIFAGFKSHVRDKSEDELAKMILAEWFNMEYHNVMTDASVVVRYAAQLVLKDASVSVDVQRRRAYALWYFGETLRRHGTPFGEGKKDDEELVAYLQQAATSVKSTGPPPRF